MNRIVSIRCNPYMITSGWVVKRPFQISGEGMAIAAGEDNLEASQVGLAFRCHTHSFRFPCSESLGRCEPSGSRLGHAPHRRRGRFPYHRHFHRLGSESGTQQAAG